MSNEVRKTGLGSIKAHGDTANNILEELNQNEVVNPPSQNSQVQKVYKPQSATIKQNNAEKQPDQEEPPKKSYTKLILVVIAIIGVIIYAYSGSGHKKSSSYVPPSTKTTTQQSTPKKSTTSEQSIPKAYEPPAKGVSQEISKIEIKYVSPPVHSTRPLTMDELHWVAREQIFMEEYKRLINRNNPESIEEYNLLVEHFNNRGGHFTYMGNDWEQAKRDVEPYREQFKQAVRDDVRQRGWYPRSSRY